jgi:hypothetical protein
VPASDFGNPRFSGAFRNWHASRNEPGKAAKSGHVTGFREAAMFNFDKFDLQRISVALVGALMLSSLCVGAAVAPAEAAMVVPVGEALLVTHA